MSLIPPALQRHYGVFYESFAPTLVKVVALEGSAKTIQISWNAPTISGTEYRVYGSLSPTTRSFIGSYPNQPITLKVPTSSVIIPPETPYHFWVSAVTSTGEQFIEDRPALIFTAEDRLEIWHDRYQLLPECDYNKATVPVEMLAFYRDEIRRRHIATLDIGGEDFLLFKRRLEGKVCEHCFTPEMGRKINPEATAFDPTIQTELNESRFHGLARCEICFGTGIVGGFYFPIPIRLGFLGRPAMNLHWKNRGVEITEAPNSWTLWTPLIKQHDLLLRMVNKNMYVVRQVELSSWQNSLLSQRLNFESLPPDDIQSRVTKTAIQNALQQYGLIEEEIPLWLF